MRWTLTTSIFDGDGIISNLLKMFRNSEYNPVRYVYTMDTTGRVVNVLMQTKVLPTSAVVQESTETGDEKKKAGDQDGSNKTTN